ncbi:hypothetical protein RQP46_008943 [Phenoliferia psychrophenolica]
MSILLRRALSPLTTSASWRLTPSLLTVRHTSDFARPAPPQLPRAQQREFEELLRRVNAPASQPAEGVEEDDDVVLEISMEDLAMHPDFRKKPKPGFEGTTNPETGEIGGPKNEPLKHGDWSYGGKCTDF